MNRPLVLDAFYPIVPDVGWLARLAPLGIKTVQLRWKGEAGGSEQIASALAIADEFGLELIVNDYWKEAIDLGASFIHLGQEDLAAADLEVIKSAGLKFGISTHNHAELKTALAAGPDYVALGPIWETKLKAMSHSPQGLERLSEWCRLAHPIPVVAIGGITMARADSVIDAGACSASVITDFLTHANPEQRVSEWVAWSRSRG